MVKYLIFASALVFAGADMVDSFFQMNLNHQIKIDAAVDSGS